MLDRHETTKLANQVSGFVDHHWLILFRMFDTSVDFTGFLMIHVLLVSSNQPNPDCCYDPCHPASAVGDPPGLYWLSFASHVRVSTTGGSQNGWFM